MAHGKVRKKELGARRRPIAIDLFAGAGGLSLGFEKAGFDIRAAVEADPVHAAIHQLNFPETPVLVRDVRRVTGKQIRSASGIGRSTIDVVVGGPPCQGFSVMGKHHNADERNTLLREFFRIVIELKPRIFLLENVPGLTAPAHKTRLDKLVADFERHGYRVRVPVVLNARQFGVPQDRRRVFITGSRKGTRVALLPADAPASFVNVQEAIEDLPLITDEASSVDEVPSAYASKGSLYAQILRGDQDDLSDFGYRRDVSNLISGCAVSNHSERSKKRFLNTPEGSFEPVSRFYRLSWSGVCHTLRAGTGSDRGSFSAPRPIHPSEARCITIREAARLHGYPDWFRFHSTIWHGFREIGNSVPPPLARDIAARLILALGIEPSKPTRVLPLGVASLAHLSAKNARALVDEISGVLKSS